MMWLSRATFRGPQIQRRFLRRRGGWGISHRRLGSDREVGPAAATWTYAVRSTRPRGQGGVRGAGERYPTHLGGACPQRQASVRAPLNVRHLRKQLALLSPRILNKLRLRIEHHRRTRRQFVRPPRRDPRVRRIATTSERNESFTHLIRRLLRIRIRSGA